MTQQVTNGIKISVKPSFEGTAYRDNRLYFVFNYTITIKNESNDTVQLLERSWTIFDSLNNVELVEGVGVVGEKPVLKPGQNYTYNSFAMLTSPVGAMKGFYTMVNFTTTKSFKVYIPNFQLMVSMALN